MSLSPSKLLIADDHPLFRAAMAAAIQRYAPDCVCMEADSFEQLQALLGDHDDADMVLLDLHMPGVNGFSGLAWLCGHWPAMPVVMVSANEDPGVIQRALAEGAAGFIPKSADAATIQTALGHVLAGESWSPVTASGVPSSHEDGLAARVGQLTPQQYRVLMMISQGLLNKQIAWELSITEATVKAHVTAIMRKLGVNNRTQAVTLFNQLAVARPELRAVAKSSNQNDSNEVDV
jgi:DNA-binding NarL/FixJ family response regulator